MRLTLSTAAAPGVDPGALLEACARRGFAAVELDGVDAVEARGWAWEAARAGVALAAIRPRTVAEGLTAAMAEAAAEMGVPVVLPAPCGAECVQAAVRSFARAGALLFVPLPADADAARALAARLGDAVGLAWEAHPARGSLPAAAPLLAAAGARLRYVRLHGGGPETAGQGGAGVGEAMLQLALARYAGPLALVPSDARYLPAWTRWLARRAGTGCGSRAADPVPLARGPIALSGVAP